MASSIGAIMRGGSMKYDVFVNSPQSRYFEIEAASVSEARAKALEEYLKEIKYQVDEHEEEDAGDYCDGCEHVVYEQPNGLSYCKLNKVPQPHPDEPEHLHCESRRESE